MIRETELNLFVPSPELLVRLASGSSPLGVKAGPPRIEVLRETYFDTPDQTLWNRGMTCKLRQVEGERPSVVVTVGEGPDSEGITSRSRLTAAAIGVGVFETLGGDSEPATQIQKFVDPAILRPQIALDIQRMGRAHRRGLLRRAVLLLLFDRITVQVGATSTVFHELRIRRRREGGPLIRDLGQELRDSFHLFPDGLSTLQRARRILSMSRQGADLPLSPYALSLSLALFRDGDIGMRVRGPIRALPTFRGSGEDAARALLSDLTGDSERPLSKLGSTEPRESRPVLEVWTVPGPLAPEAVESATARLEWYPWHRLLADVGKEGLMDPPTISSLLLLSRRRLAGGLSWVPRLSPSAGSDGVPSDTTAATDTLAPELQSLDSLLSVLARVEDVETPLKERLGAVSHLSETLSEFFRNQVTGIKGRILSEADPADREEAIRLLDLISIRFRGMADRLYACLSEDLLPALVGADVHLRAWSGLMHQDRRSLLDHFAEAHLPSMSVAAEWGPSFIPDMPPSGCAVGLLARTPAAEGTRFFHIVLAPETPSFLRVPGSNLVLPLEEVVRGYFLSRESGLERAETHLFRFTTGEATVRGIAPRSEVDSQRREEPLEDGERDGEALELAREAETLSSFADHQAVNGVPKGSPAWSESRAGRGTKSRPEAERGMESAPEVTAGNPGGIQPGNPGEPSPDLREVQLSFVVRVLTGRGMPEAYQAQLLRALERQVSRRNPLIGWSDLHPLPGPLNLKGIHELLDSGSR